MAFLRNDAINRVNLHSGIQALAQNAGGVFILVFLLRAGVPIPLVLVAQAAIVAVRFILRPAILPLAIRFGVKPLLVAGALALCLQYLVLAEVRGPGWPLILLCGVTACAELVYHLANNAFVASAGDAEHRGHQSGVREALVAVAGVVAPLIGAWGLVTVGPRWTFAAVALVQILSTAPLWRLPNVPVARSAPGAFAAARPGIVLNALDGAFDAVFFILWPIALFVTLGQSFTVYGGAMALAGLVGAACALLLGPWADKGLGRSLVTFAYALAAVIVALRAVSLVNPALAVAANALGAVLMPLMVPPLIRVVYNLSQASPCTFRFSMATEGAWDGAAFVVCLVMAGLIWLGTPLPWLMLLAVPPALVSGLVLRRRYAGSLPAPG